MPSYVVDYERIPERPGAGRLGRHYKKDSRSGAYRHRRTAEAVQDVTWARYIPILDQGQLGSCTGNAETGALGCDPCYGGLPSAHPHLDEQLALSIYSDAEKLDGGSGYPPEDQGSTGQSVCQVAKNRGLISGYTWCQDLADCLDALQSGPVLLGVNWYSSFDEPDVHGVVALPSSAYIRGGHEILARELDTKNELVWCDNSWGTGWGLQGRFAFPYQVLTRLFAEQGDCAVPKPASAPTPAPTPTPAPDPGIHVDAADRTLAGALPHGWAAGPHTGSNSRAAGAVEAWLHAKGLA